MRKTELAVLEQRRQRVEHQMCVHTEKEMFSSYN